MEIFSKLFGKKNKEVKVGGMEDFMTLIRVYFQASLAAGIGINNLGMLPDLRTFKATLHVPTSKIKSEIRQTAFSIQEPVICLLNCKGVLIKKI